MQSSEQVLREIHDRLGYVPSMFAPVADNAALLSHLWHQTLEGYLDSPMPPLFKNKLFAYLSRHASSPYCLVTCCCELWAAGVKAADILALLETPTPAEDAPQPHDDLLASSRTPLDITSEPEGKVELPLLFCAASIFLDQAGADRCRTVLRRVLSPAFYSSLVSLLGGIKFSHTWTDSYADIRPEQDERIRSILPQMLREEPRLDEVFRTCSRQARRERHQRETALVAQIAAQDQHDQLIRASETRFRRAVSHAPFPVMIYAEDGEVIQINQAWTELSGYVTADIPTYTDWLHKARHKKGRVLKEDMDALFEEDSRVEQGEYIITTASRQKRTWDLCSAPLGRLPDGRRLVITMASDVTERKWLEQTLWDTNRRIIAMLESITDGFFSVDHDWRFAYLNPRAEQLAGKTREQLIGRSIWDVFPAMRDSAVFVAATHSLENDTPGHIEAHYAPRDAWLEFYFYPSSHGLSVFFRDISARHTIEDRLRETNEQLEAIIQASPLAVISLDREGVVRLWSPAAERMFGYTQREAVGQKLPVVPDSQRETFAHQLTTLVSGTPIDGEVSPRQRKDGTVIDTARWIAILRDPNGSVAGSLGLIADVTAQRRASSAIRLLADAGAALVASLDLETTLRSVASLAVPSLADWCIVDLLDDNGSFRRLAVAHANPAHQAMAQALRHRFGPHDDRPYWAAHIASTGQPQLSAEVTAEMIAAAAQDPEHLQLLTAMHIRSCMAIPLLARGRTLGVLTFFTADSGRRFDAQDLTLAQDLGRLAALAVDNARLYAELARSSRDVSGVVPPANGSQDACV